jgi:hypothetical protein
MKEREGNKMAEGAKEVKKITLGLISSWIFGILFLLVGTGVIAQGSYDSNTNSCDLNLTYTGQMLLGQQYQVGQPIDSATVQFG